MAEPAALAALPGPVLRALPQRRLWILIGVVTLVVVALSLLILDRRLASEIGTLSEKQTEQRVHIERVTSVWRDCQKAQVVLLERWLEGPDPRGERARRVLILVDAVRRESAELDQLPASSIEEGEVRARLRDALASYTQRVQANANLGEGASHLEELRTNFARIDLWAGRVVEVNSAAGEETSQRLKLLHDSRTTMQLGFAITVGSILVLAVWWRGRVRAETRQLEQAKSSQERAANLRAEFFANMSHELRTPLVAIGGFGAVIEHTAGVDPATRDRVKQIQREAKDLLGIINNILDVAKLESDHVELLIEDVAIEEVLERCVARCRGLVGDKPLAIAVEIPPGVPPVRGDFVKLQQVFTNLISNAIKFTESGRVGVRVAAAPGTVRIAVEDTGVGIRPEALRTIWEPFRQADHKVSRKFGGTGLGLAIVRGVVSRLGGQVAVESTVGIGTTFTVTLPAAGPAAATPPAAVAR